MGRSKSKRPTFCAPQFKPSVVGTIRRVCFTLSLLACSTSAAQPNVIIDESFSFTTGVMTAPGSACDAPLAVGSDWLLGNDRQDFTIPPSVELQLEVANGSARIYSTTNSALGGYQAFFQELTPLSAVPASWRLTTTLKVDVSFPSREVPQCNIQVPPPAPGSLCSPLFPQHDGIRIGWQMGVGRVVELVDGGAVPVASTYMLPADGTWHVIELQTTGTCSELRGWPVGGTRPVDPSATGLPLGGAYMVEYHGPNFMNYDYSIDHVTLESLVNETFTRGDCNTDGNVNIADVVALLGMLFPNGTPAALECIDACDGNDDGETNIADGVRLLSSLFGAPTTPLTGPAACGVDPTDTDSLDCANSPACP